MPRPPSLHPQEGPIMSVATTTGTDILQAQATHGDQGSRTISLPTTTTATWPDTQATLPLLMSLPQLQIKKGTTSKEQGGQSI
jgi:hypothetical protein